MSYTFIKHHGNLTLYLSLLLLLFTGLPLVLWTRMWCGNLYVPRKWSWGAERDVGWSADLWGPLRMFVVHFVSLLAGYSSVGSADLKLPFHSRENCVSRSLRFTRENSSDLSLREQPVFCVRRLLSPLNQWCSSQHHHHHYHRRESSLARKNKVT